MPTLLAVCVCVLGAFVPGLVAAEQSSAPFGPAESVIGGADAPAGAFPSIVAIVKRGSFSPIGRLFCGGTIVESTWILTAAHCLFDSNTNLLRDPSTIRVIGGIENLRSDTGLEETVVTNIIVHPDYDHGTSNKNDIALLELATPLAQPASDLYLGERSGLDGAQADVVGWGATFFVTPRLATYPAQLQSAVVPIVPMTVCNAPNSFANTLVDSQICAGFPEGGVDACAGDSGGPLYVNVNGVREQAGIVSFGRGCALPNLYGIYTSVPAFAVWLSQYITIDLDQLRGPGEEPIDSPGDGSGGQDNGSNPPISSSRGGSGAPDVYLLVALLLLLRRRAQRP